MKEVPAACGVPWEAPHKGVVIDQSRRRVSQDSPGERCELTAAEIAMSKGKRGEG